ncbi:hypothetical protein DEO72_LG5g2205 [Vigna unguiculata]|uniref:Uncharacterized protein n=1 Tax=Vigna unguiculata TaxID=3917 RepID=A0A4D6M1S0_VIGUN|nr:hypothetical protein DEO72_LG5g2205 [Vigna unguiculata]
MSPSCSAPVRKCCAQKWTSVGVPKISLEVDSRKHVSDFRKHVSDFRTRGAFVPRGASSSSHAKASE